MLKPDLKMSVYTSYPATKLKVVRFRPFSLAVAPQLYQWAETPGNDEYFRRYPPKANWMDDARVMQAFGSTWVIYEDETPVGLVNMHSVDPFSRSCEIGTLVDKASSAHHHQTSHAAGNLLCDYAFNYMNLHKIYMKILDNREHLKVRLEDVGFVCEATLRDSIYFKGEYRNEYLMSCLKLEFKEVDPAISYAEAKMRLKEKS